MKIEVWWEELKYEDNNKQGFMFLHLIDSEGNIRHNKQIGLAGYKKVFQDRPWRYDSITFTWPVDPNVKALAFGVFHLNRPGGEITCLEADKGTRDWNGQRVVVPLTATR